MSCLSLSSIFKKVFSWLFIFSYFQNGLWCTFPFSIFRKSLSCTLTFFYFQKDFLFQKELLKVKNVLRCGLVDCPTQLIVFHDKYQSYKYEEIQQGNLLDVGTLHQKIIVVFVCKKKLCRGHCHATGGDGVLIPSLKRLLVSGIFPWKEKHFALWQQKVGCQNTRLFTKLPTHWMSKPHLPHPCHFERSSHSNILVENGISLKVQLFT